MITRLGRTTAITLTTPQEELARPMVSTSDSEAEEALATSISRCLGVGTRTALEAAVGSVTTSLVAPTAN